MTAAAILALATGLVYPFAKLAQAIRKARRRNMQERLQDERILQQKQNREATARHKRVRP